MRRQKHQLQLSAETIKLQQQLKQVQLQKLEHLRSQHQCQVLELHNYHDQQQQLAHKQEQQLAHRQEQEPGRRQQQLVNGKQQQLVNGKQQQLVNGKQQQQAHKQEQQLAHGQEQQLAHGQEQQLAHGEEQQQADGHERLVSHSKDKQLAVVQGWQLAHEQEQQLAHGQEKQLASRWGHQLAVVQDQQIGWGQNEELYDRFWKTTRHKKAEERRQQPDEPMLSLYYQLDGHLPEERPSPVPAQQRQSAHAACQTGWSLSPHAEYHFVAVLPSDLSSSAGMRDCAASAAAHAVSGCDAASCETFPMGSMAVWPADRQREENSEHQTMAGGQGHTRTVEQTQSAGASWEAESGAQDWRWNSSDQGEPQPHDWRIGALEQAFPQPQDWRFDAPEQILPQPQDWRLRASEPAPTDPPHWTPEYRGPNWSWGGGWNEAAAVDCGTVGENCSIGDGYHDPLYLGLKVNPPKRASEQVPAQQEDHSDNFSCTLDSEWAPQQVPPPWIDGSSNSNDTVNSERASEQVLSQPKGPVCSSAVDNEFTHYQHGPLNDLWARGVELLTYVGSVVVASGQVEWREGAEELRLEPVVPPSEAVLPPPLEAAVEGGSSYCLPGFRSLMGPLLDYPESSAGELWPPQFSPSLPISCHGHVPLETHWMGAPAPALPYSAISRRAPISSRYTDTLLHSHVDEEKELNLAGPKQKKKKRACRTALRQGSNHKKPKLGGRVYTCTWPRCSKAFCKESTRDRHLAKMHLGIRDQAPAAVSPVRRPSGSVSESLKAARQPPVKNKSCANDASTVQAAKKFKSCAIADKKLSIIDSKSTAATVARELGQITQDFASTVSATVSVALASFVTAEDGQAQTFSIVAAGSTEAGNVYGQASGNNMGDPAGTMRQIAESERCLGSGGGNIDGPILPLFITLGDSECSNNNTAKPCTGAQISFNHNIDAPETTYSPLSNVLCNDGRLQQPDSHQSLLSTPMPSAAAATNSYRRSGPPTMAVSVTPVWMLKELEDLKIATSKRISSALRESGQMDGSIRPLLEVILKFVRTSQAAQYFRMGRRSRSKFYDHTPPLDLDTVQDGVARNQYRSLDEFIGLFQQMHDYCSNQWGQRDKLSQRAAHLWRLVDHMAASMRQTSGV